ncbi:MAG: bifunctional hydroxymethylpyrimidine kinase/phosphomethylpyrimidine kinase [Nitrospirae bacterium]|nr:MAG: bifunctional hydroxymethylpyrimidine kinase/phosphomethylpyrimidine kinase [Nitrospirota bacterium]
MFPQVLTIAGSDSGGGAGIQADLKAMSANGVFALSVITSITAQNTRHIRAIYDLPISIIASQLDAVFEDFEITVVKVGMLSSSAIIHTVGTKLTQYGVSRLIVDPVMVAKSGQPLLQDNAIETLKTQLIPQALLLTPNIHEAQLLANQSIQTLAEARQAAKAIHRLGCQYVLIKGGHLRERPATDLLYDGRFFRMYQSEMVPTTNTHGTGCTYASAIAAHLARGKPLPEAIEAAKAYITQTLRHAIPIGHGQGPVNHFYFLTTDSPTS